MTLDPLPPLQAHKRERREYDRTTYEEWLVEEDVHAHEESGGAWDAVMAAAPAHRRSEHWPTGPDRRIFSVDGDLIEQARRDALHLDVDLRGGAA